MTQETRKDPRAKVLTMTVRYKSATLDEFIEHHSHDVSRGGMFIKTPSPFPPGTLLKFEVRISGEQRVMQGVGRVVWKRESAEVADARPAGMGVKFIKIDDESRRVIDQLVTARGAAASAFDQGGDVAAGGRGRDPSAGVAPPVSGAREGTPSSKARKATMIGLGAMSSEPESPETAAAEAFFPPAPSNPEMPAPEDRTVMKQAAELLQDALREAGGSLEEVGTKEAPAREVPRAEPVPTPVAPVAKAEGAKVDVAPAARPASSENSKAEQPKSGKTKSERSVIVNAQPREEVTQPAARRPSGAPPARSEPAKPARSAAAQEAAGAAADSGSGGRLVLALIAVAAVVGVVIFLNKSEDAAPEPEAPPAAEQPAAVAPPEPVPAAEPAPAAEPSAAAASAEPATSALLPGSAVAPPPIAPVPSAPVAQPPAVTKPAPAARPTPAPRRPKPAAPAAPTAAAPTAAAPTSPGDTPPSDATAQPPETAAPKPKAPPKAPKPQEPAGDNPY